MHRSIDLHVEQLQKLERLAAQQRRTVDELLQLAVGDYLARSQAQADWSTRLAAAVEAIRANVPVDATPEEVEADITSAWAEHRAQRAGQRRSPD